MNEVAKRLCNRYAEKEGCRGNDEREEKEERILRKRDGKCSATVIGVFGKLRNDKNKKRDSNAYRARASEQLDNNIFNIVFHI